MFVKCFPKFAMLIFLIYAVSYGFIKFHNGVIFGHILKLQWTEVNTDAFAVVSNYVFTFPL